MPPALTEVWYASTSSAKEDGGLRRYVSNFTAVPGGVSGHAGRTYATVEAAFHAAKAGFVLPTSHGSVNLAAYVDALAVPTLTGKDAKRMGGRRAWEAMGLQLDKTRWDASSWKILRSLLQQRVAKDARLREAVRELTSYGSVPLRHFARNVHYRSKSTGELVGADTAAGMTGEVIVAECAAMGAWANPLYSWRVVEVRDGDAQVARGSVAGAATVARALLNLVGMSTDDGRILASLPVTAAGGDPVVGAVVLQLPVS